MKTPKPSAWTDPPAASLRIVLTTQGQNDEQGLTQQDKAAAWDGLTDAQAELFQRLTASFMTKYFPLDTEWSIACFVATNRPNDDKRAIDFLSSSTIAWDPVDLIQEWLDEQDE